MSLKGLFNTYSNIGTKPDHKPWEASFIRKLNLLAFFGTLNVIFALTVFLSFDYTYFFWDCVLVLIFAPLVLVLNTFGKYVWSAYLFSFIGYGMFGSLNLKMGDNSHAFILYFLNHEYCSVIGTKGNDETHDCGSCYRISFG
ncbi:MAG: hypothetical protein IPG08_17615 [Sphingobacteriaceae bacterium]|nr:hypothetical protein [Sphingobacteriaceae bacterium]